MPSSHLEPAAIQQFLRGHLPSPDAARWLQHVLEGCERCARRLRDELERRRGAPAEGYDEAFLETAAFVVDRQAPLALERIAAPGLVSRLQEMGWEQRRTLVASDPRYRTWGLCERLVQESRHTVWKVHSHTLLDLARCALLVGEHLDPARYGPPYVADLMAEVHANLMNAHRLRSDFPAAHRHLRLALEHLERGTGDHVERARLASYEASLLVNLGHFERAVELLERHRRRLPPGSETDLEAKLLVQKGSALTDYDPAAAVDVYRRALELLGDGHAPRLALCARQGLVWSLNASGRSHQALMELQASRHLFRQFPDRLAQLHLRWTEARLAFDLGHMDEAEAAYQALWSSAFELGLELETALVSLDMIEVQISLGRHGDAITVASRLVDLFATWGVHRRAMQAWSLMVEALRRRSASQTLVTEVAHYLRRAWSNPDIEFTP